MKTRNEQKPRNEQKNQLDFSRFSLGMFALALVGMLATAAFADPCGMVPPIYTGPGTPITRTGLQQTYVYFDSGVESFVLRPGFKGNVDNFGMLIPFPSPPALRKVADNVFDQIANAVDPPEVVLDLTPPPPMMMMDGAQGFGGGGGGGMVVRRSKVTVLKEEAVGMYEVAVLEAGSPEALKAWMDKNNYVYPKGMDAVTLDYINEGWCFVAVKTKVAPKADANPRPGQRRVNPQLPAGGSFDGTVQGLGFRFKTDKLVVPMRLSAFNEGELRNVVYLLTKGGKRINAIPEEYVVRQLDGKELVANLTQPLPLRVIGGTWKDVPEYKKKGLDQRRNPVPKNGVAKQLFASDILAKDVAGLSLEHEEEEKELLRIGEHFGLRGEEVNAQLAEVSKEALESKIAAALPTLEQMTLTVVDGDFPREVIANQNLTFADFQMDQLKNNARGYDTKLHKPGMAKRGNLISANEIKAGEIKANVFESDSLTESQLDSAVSSSVKSQRLPAYVAFGSAGMILLLLSFFKFRQETL